MNHLKVQSHLTTYRPTIQTWENIKAIELATAAISIQERTIARTSPDYTASLNNFSWILFPERKLCGSNKINN